MGPILRLKYRLSSVSSILLGARWSFDLGITDETHVYPGSLIHRLSSVSSDLWYICIGRSRVYSSS